MNFPVPLRVPIPGWRGLALLVAVILLASGFALLQAARLAAPQPLGTNAVETTRPERLAEIDARFRQGVAMLQAGQNEYAVVAFHRVLKLAPKLPDAHVNLGYALLDLKRYQAAHDFFLSAIELKPNQINAYYGLALALEHLGDLPGAIGAMRSYVHLAPANAPQVRKARSALWEWETTNVNSAKKP
jgi:tetratricopeptide (TPR) repeat protein